MRRLPAWLKIAAVAFAVSGCTVGIDDRPVPPELIPGASGTASFSSGMTQPDDATDSAVPVESVESEPLDPPSSGGSMRWQTGAQPVRVTSGTSESVDEPAIPQAEEPVAEAVDPGPDETGGDSSETASVAPSLPADASFRLASFVGIGSADGDRLKQAMRRAASRRGIELSGDAGAPVLKGYFSSMPAKGGSAVIYVWDIYDASGTRLTRIDGQEPADDAIGDELDGVSPEILDKIAEDAAKRLAAWLGQKPA